MEEEDREEEAVLAACATFWIVEVSMVPHSTIILRGLEGLEERWVWAEGIMPVVELR